VNIKKSTNLALVEPNGLLLEHLGDALLVLVAEQSEFAHLLVLELLDDQLLLVLGRGLQDVRLERLVLPRLNFARLAELLPDQRLLLLQTLGLLLQLERVLLAQVALRPRHVLALRVELRQVLPRHLQHAHTQHTF
jgi:hypothetical protein